MGSKVHAWGWFEQILNSKAGGETMEIKGTFPDVFKPDSAGDWKLAWCAYSPDHE